MVVTIFSQLDFNGVNLWGGTGTLLISYLNLVFYSEDYSIYMLF